MPTIADYLRLAPFTLDELVAATNGVLRGHPRLEVTRRTLRYYVAEGVLPPPSGPPKFARYEGEHLLRAVGVRIASARGRTLAEARGDVEEILRADDAGRELQRRVERLASDAAMLPDREEESPPSVLLETPAPTLRKAIPAPSRRGDVPRLESQTWTRCRLAPDLMLEVSGVEVRIEDLRRAEREIRRILDSSENT